MKLYAWAARWRIPPQAIAELQTVYGLDGTPGDDEHAGKKSEAFAQSQVVFEGAQKGIRLWRNNVGAFQDDTGRLIRYGLANDSKQLNAVVKSGDLIGIRPVRIGPEHVGQVIGQMVSREIKAPGWRYSETPREVAQLRWAEMIMSLGGDAGFATGPGSL